jgi:serine/threonine protein phosphatase PrpC
VIPTDKPHLHVAAYSHPGEVRTKNEDRHSVTAYRLERSSTASLIAVVADGIGGHRAGEVASEMSVDSIVRCLGEVDGKQPVQQLFDAVTQANQDVFLASRADTDLEGMGSTVSVAWVIGAQLYISSVGDSRIYRLHKSILQQISIDHTWVQEAIEHEIIRPDQARDHPQAHVLRRHIGGKDEVVPDMRLRLSEDENDNLSESNQGLQLDAGDKILLCTDGLTDLVDDQEIQETLNQEPAIDAVASLIDLARERGGYDNITVVILEVPETEKPEQKPRSRRNKWFLITALSVVLLIVIVAVVLAVSWLLGLWPWS